MSEFRTMRDLSPEERALLAIREPLIRDHIAARAVIFCQEAGDLLGSGTLVAFHGTPMIATAAHVAEALMEAHGALVFAALVPHKPVIKRFHDLARSWATSPVADLAAIVLRPDAPDCLPGTAWLHTSDVGVGPMGTPETVIQIGSPLEVRDLCRSGGDYPKVDGSRGQVAVMVTTCLKSCDVDAHAADENYGPRHRRWPPEKDLHIDWSERDVQPDGIARVKMPHPGGMSGGGVWDWRCPLGEVWTPSRLRLVAINWSFTPAANCVRAIPAADWLAVARDAAAQA